MKNIIAYEKIFSYHCSLCFSICFNSIPVFVALCTSALLATLIIQWYLLTFPSTPRPAMNLLLTEYLSVINAQTVTHSVTLRCTLECGFLIIP